jgi:DNA-binding CsgD family transcriptional regulator
LTLAAEGERAALLLGEAIDALPVDERELGIRLEAELYVAGYMSSQARRFVTLRAPRFQPDRERLETAGDRVMLGIEALEIAFTRGPAHEAVELAQHALSDGSLLADQTADANAFYAASCVLYYADAFAPSLQVFSSAVDDSLRRGSVRGAAMAAGWRAMTHQRRGNLADAEADARQLLDRWELVGPIGLLVGTVPVFETLLERGQLEAADRLLDASGLGGPLPATLLNALVLHPRARLRLEQRRLDEALADLEACGAFEEAWGIRTPAVTSWRATAALVHAALGERGTARDLAEEEVARARAFGAPRPLGIALRAAGLVADGPQGVELLRDAVRVLDPSGAEVEHARALVDLGSTLRRGGQRSEARGPLSAGLAKARRCGALALAARAHEELEASGVHQRKILLTGVEALTPSERRVAQMAADGMRNRDIAQALFVTVKTVEGHLTNAYLKLDLHAREDLARALAGGIGD